MKNRILHILIAALTLIGLAAFTAPARAGTIGAEQVAAQSQAQAERERIKALVARPEIAKELQTLGVPPENAQARVDAMTDTEVAALAGKLDSLPAAGALSDFQWIMIIIGVVIIALLI